MTEDEVLNRIREECGRLGSQKDLAEKWGFSNAYISDVLRGRRDLGPAILAAMGLERVVTYRKRAENKGGFSRGLDPESAS